MFDGLALQLTSLDGLTLAGVTLGFIGSVTILIPEISLLQPYVLPEERISRLRCGQQTLLMEHKITEEDYGFEGLCDVFDPVVELPMDPHTILIDNQKGGEDTQVHVRYTDPDADHAYATQYAGHPASVTLLVNNAINDIRQRVRHRYLTVGVVLITLGFGIRAVIHTIQLSGL